METGQKDVLVQTPIDLFLFVLLTIRFIKKHAVRHEQKCKKPLKNDDFFLFLMVFANNFVF